MHDRPSAPTDTMGSDLRQGVCPSEFYLNEAACCAGLEVGSAHVFHISPPEPH